MAKRKSKRLKELEFEVGFFRSLLETNPGFIEALTALGDTYTKLGENQKGLEIDLKLAELRPENPFVFYNLACSYSLLEETQKAFDALAKSIELGYDDFEHMKNDKDLLNVFRDKRFTQWLTDIQNNRIRKTQKIS